MEIPTVRIKADNRIGYAIINESDFNSEEHELFDDTETDEESTVELDVRVRQEEATGDSGQHDEALEVEEPPIIERIRSTLEAEASGETPEQSLPNEKPDGTPPEPKSRKRRGSVGSSI